MTPELTVLLLGLLLQGLQFALFALPANVELGTAYTASPRDVAPPRPLSLSTGRLQRALNNQFEALILFAPAALIVGLTGQTTAYTASLAWVWLIARAAYVPAYAFGLNPWRSAIWGFGFLATMLLALAALV